MSQRTLLRLLTISLFVGLFCMVSAPVFACMQVSCEDLCPNCSYCRVSGSSVFCSGCNVDNESPGQELIVPPGPQTTVIFHKENRVRIKVDGYRTTVLNPGTDCVTGFPPLESVQSVDAVVNYNGLTDEPFSEVEFYALEGPGWAIAELAEEEGLGSSDLSWYSFRSHITGSVEDGVPNYFIVELTLKEGTDPMDFVEELKSSGVFLTAGSDEEGVPNHHPFFRQLNSGALMIGMSSSFYTEAPGIPELPLPSTGRAEF